MGNKVKKTTSKKKYTAPTLRGLGSVIELTKGGFHTSGDLHGSSEPVYLPFDISKKS